jgi:CSLREA domain-containing protein
MERRPAIACLVGVVEDAAAATFVVTTITDSNDGAYTVALCSLRDAVIASNANPGGNTRRWR